MSDINAFICTGRLTRDAVVKNFSSTGKSLMTVGLAVNTGFGDKKETLFLELNKWGTDAKGFGLLEYLKKGTMVGVQGSIKRDEYTSNNGKEYVNIVLNVSRIDLISSGRQSDNKTGASSNEDVSDTPVF